MASLAQTLASIRGEGWKVTKNKDGTWRVRQKDVEYRLNRAQLFEFSGKVDAVEKAPEDPHLRGTTCADRPYLAERLLRILERAPRIVSHLEVIDELIEHAGPAFARESIDKSDQRRGGFNEVPF